MNKYSNVLSSKKIGTIEIRNRVIMPAMSSHYSNQTGDFIEVCKDYYKERAKGGTGLIVTEFCAVDKSGVAEPCELRCYDESHLTGLKRISTAVQAWGAKIFLQLHHAGRGTSSQLIGQQPMAPSAITAKTEIDGEILEMEMPKEMTIKDIKYIKERFIESAVLAKKAGFDGVELHGAHGYLFWQFISPASNQRTDCYGGSVENRVRIVKEVVEGIKEHCGKNFPISFRMSILDGYENGMNLEMGIEMAKILENVGLDMLNISTGSDLDGKSIIAPASYKQGFMVEYAAAVKKETNLAIAVVGMIRDFDYCESIIRENKTDFVVMGRPHLADPYMVNKIATGRENLIRKCLTCMGCLDGEARLGCSFNPIAGYEGEYNAFKKDGEQRKVVVIGGGPSGAEAARVFAVRNFNVVLFEKSSRLGGQVMLAGVPADKLQMNNLEKYYKNMLPEVGVEVRYNTEATVESVAKEEPYLVVVATGSVPIIPPIEGINLESVWTAEDVLSKRVVLEDKNVVIVGSGNTGIETAEYLLQTQNKITLVDMIPKIGATASVSGNYVMQDIKNKIEKLPNAKLSQVHTDYALFVDVKENKEIKLYFDALVLSLGVKKNDSMLKSLNTVCDNILVVGDALNVGNIGTSIRSGFFTAFCHEVEYDELV